MKYIYIYIYIYNLIKIIQNLQVCYLKFHAMNDDKDLVLLENCHSWRETLSSKFVNLYIYICINIKIALLHCCSPLSLLLVCRASFVDNTSGGLLLNKYNFIKKNYS